VYIGGHCGRGGDPKLECFSSLSRHGAIVARLARAGASLTCQTVGSEVTPYMTAIANGHAKVGELIEDLLEEREKPLRKEMKRLRKSARH
jgi:hypothetical protein